jgi:protein-tyrosine-phosphatase
MVMPEPAGPLRVLFLCTGNSARSQIAEALLLRKAGGRFFAASAGTEPAPEIHPQTVSALGVAGIDWSGRRPKGIEAVRSESWDVIITTCDESRESCPTFGGQPIYAHWSIPDPAAEVPPNVERAFQQAVQAIARRIDLMLAVRLDERREPLREALRATETGTHQVVPTT